MPATKPTMLQAAVALYGSIGGGLPTLYLDEVPETASYPRAVIRHRGEQPVAGSYDGATGLPIECQGDFEIEISVENDSDQAEALAIIVMQAFTLTALAMTTDPAPRMWRTSYTVRRTGDRTPAAKPVYAATMSYRAMFGTNY